MADLNNLLGELDEYSQQSIVAQDPVDDVLSERADDENVVPELPPVLKEAERGRHEDDASLDVGEKTNLEETAEDEDYAQLKRLWIHELNSPDLGEYDGETVGLLMELLEGQEESIEKLNDHASRDREIAKDDANMAALMADIYKMDADRVRFMLTDLTRTRLTKIEQHALYMRGMVDRMSEDEISYLKQYGELLERHLRRSVLDHLPKEAWRRLDEPEMIDSPNMDEFVFCKVLETVEIDNRNPNQDKDDLVVDSIQEHDAGACLIARYSAIQSLVQEGKIALLM